MAFRAAEWLPPERGIAQAGPYHGMRLLTGLEVKSMDVWEGLMWGASPLDPLCEAILFVAFIFGMIVVVEAVLTLFADWRGRVSEDSKLRRGSSLLRSPQTLAAQSKSFDFSRSDEPQKMW